MIHEWKIRNYCYIRKKHTPYKSPWTKEQAHLLLSTYNKVFDEHIAIRLDSLSGMGATTQLQISKVDFTELYVTNILYAQALKSMHVERKDIRKMINDFCERVDRDRIYDSLQSFLSKDYLANVIGLSVLIRDRNGKFLITKRNGKVGISQNYMCVSVTGALSEEDFDEPDPIKAGAIRECLEELSYDIEYDEIRVNKIACGRSKIQPAAMVDVLVDDIQDIIDNLKGLEGFEEENQAFFKWTKSDIEASLNDISAKYTEIGTAHLLGAIKE